MWRSANNPDIHIRWQVRHDDSFAQKSGIGMDRTRANLTPLLLALPAVFSAGCAADRIHLSQPFAPPSQMEMDLAVSGAAYDDTGARRHILLECPLPGAQTGFAAFQVFLDVPRDTPEARIDPTDPAAARGFFIQEVGRLRGKSIFTSGAIRTGRIWFRRDILRIELDLSDAFGMRLIGRARLRPDALRLQQYRMRRTADIALLSPNATSRPTTQATATRSTTATQPTSDE
ncbi:MAG: hypothetical protein D6744_06585 [Planctomycetota bacterium]|nr:MAG: hypothetical protein D6744_06585 [Planctomycetota bacterium]